MSQSRFGSFVEGCANIAIGFGVNFTANWLILPVFGFSSLTLRSNFEIGMLYTLISLARSFLLRRWFNNLRLWNR